MSPLLVLLSAKRRGGKDTLADYLVEKRNFRRVGFADALKDEVSASTGIPRAEFDDEDLKETAADGQTMTRRQLLQEFGSWKRSLDPSYFTRQCRSTVRKLLQKGISVVVSDARFPNELESSEFNLDEKQILRIRINRPSREHLYGKDEHESETALDAYDKFDAYITNVEGDKNAMFKQMDDIIRAV